MPDEERRQVIESYPAIQNLQYQPPAALPTASQRMNKGQQKEDTTLKRIQYLLSAVFRPLDILGHELSIASDMSQADRYLQILGDARRLILHSSSSITSSRNNIAFRAINPGFQAPEASSSLQYTVSPPDFQTSLTN